jgi:hypothetical protein
MLDEPTELRLKAEACRRLAVISEDDTKRVTLWLERAGYWEDRAVKAAHGAKKE